MGRAVPVVKLSYTSIRVNINFRKTLAVAPFLLAAGVLLAGLLGSFPFGSDEGENMLGAISVARGGDIYKVFISQHTPFAYYCTSLFALMGIKSVIGFRIAFNAIILIFWLVIYRAYAGRMNKRIFLFVMAAYPLMAPFCLGHLILADVFTAYALVVLLIEYLRYLEDKTLSPGRMIIISLCVFVAVMSCFVGIYAVFIMLLGFGAGELKGLSRAVLPGRCRRLLLFLLVLALPFGLLLGWYAATDNLRNFYEQAYVFNRTVYSRYVGIGTSAVLPFISMPLTWLRHMREVAADGLNYGAVTLSLLLTCTNIVFLANLWRRQRLAAIVIFMFLAAAGIRGYGGMSYDGFHSAPYYTVSLLIFGIVLSWLDRPQPWAWITSLCALMLFLGVTLPGSRCFSQHNMMPSFKPARVNRT